MSRKQLPPHWGSKVCPGSFHVVSRGLWFQRCALSPCAAVEGNRRMRVPAVRENARACRKLKSPTGQTYASCQHLLHTTTLNCPLSEAGTLIVVEGDGARKALQKCTFDVDCPFAYAKARFNRSVSNRSVSCPQPKVTLATEKNRTPKISKDTMVLGTVLHSNADSAWSCHPRPSGAYAAKARRLQNSTWPTLHGCEAGLQRARGCMTSRHQTCHFISEGLSHLTA